MNVYEIAEKVQIVKWHFQGNTIRQISGLFEATFQNRPIPSLSTVHRIVQNFEIHGCVSPNEHKKARVNNNQNEQEDRDIMICATVEENPMISQREVAEVVGSSETTVNRILKKHGYRSYKVRKCQEIYETDNIRRMEFSEAVMDKVNNDNNFLYNVVFTDESTFPLLARHNPSQVRYWSRENLHKFVTVRTQFPQKLNVWMGILGENVIGPFYIEGNLNSVKYLDLLRHHIVPEIRRLAGARFNNIWFQQDGCSVHNRVTVQHFLNETFPNRLLSGKGTILWPARSPDLAPCDFFCGVI